MTCREFADFIMDYLSGDLSAGMRSEFEFHLQICSNCVEYLKSYEETVKLGQRAFDDELVAVEAGVPEDLVTAILAARRLA